VVKFPQTITSSDGEWSDGALLHRAAQYLKMSKAEFSDYMAALSEPGDREYSRYLQELSLPPYVARYIRDNNLKGIARYIKRRGADFDFRQFFQLTRINL
jgi:hypothetical protein